MHAKSIKSVRHVLPDGKSLGSIKGHKVAHTQATLTAYQIITEILLKAAAQAAERRCVS